MKKLLYILLLIIAAGLCAVILFMRSDSREKEHNSQVEQLETLYAEIQNDCNNLEFETALEKAYQLNYTGYSEETRTHWDNVRKATVDYIENAMLGLAY